MTELPTVGFLCMIRGAGDELAGYRERIAELARIGANDGLFAVRVTVVDNDCAALDGVSAVLGDDRLGGWIDEYVVAVDDCPHFPSTEVSAARWRHMNWLANRGLEAMGDVDLVAVVHPDLEWEPAQMARAIDWTLAEPELLIAACPIFTRDGAYYDTWGTRLAGVPVGPDFDPDDVHYPGVSSAAGALLAPGIARHVPWTGDAEVGWCERLGRYGIGFHMLSAETIRVVHP